jgi:hypothetical protein
MSEIVPIPDADDTTTPDASDDQAIMSRFDDGLLFWGLIVGFFTGAIVWLFNVPKRGDDTRQGIKDRIESDPAKESIAEGKALARQRRSRRRDAS